MALKYSLTTIGHPDHILAIGRTVLRFGTTQALKARIHPPVRRGY